MTRLTGAACLTSLLLTAAAADTPTDTEDAVERESSQEKVIFRDLFAADLAKGWQWVREDPEDWRIEDGGLEMRTQPGRIWAGNDAENVLLRPIPEPEAGPVAAEVTATNQPTEQFEQAGLLYYFHDDRFVKLIREHVDGRWWVVMARETPDGGRVLAKQPLQARRVRLRLEVHGDQVIGEWKPIPAPNNTQESEPGQAATKRSAVAGRTPPDLRSRQKTNDSNQNPDSANWNRAAACQLPRNDEKPHFGLFTQDGPADTKHWSRFTNFQILRLP